MKNNSLISLLIAIIVVIGFVYAIHELSEAIITHGNCVRLGLERLY